MNTENINRCPKCQASVDPDSPQGLCPKCLLEAVSTPTEAGQSSEGHPVPALETVAEAFPQLEILAFVGQGGMGLVYKARQPKLDRLVALKLLPEKPGGDPTFGERFNREARVLAKLSHPNIVAVHDFGQAGPFFYLLMEFVDGVNLRQAMRAGRFTPAQALSLVPKICDALQYAHEEGVLHRDIKPENLLLDTRGRVKIADFGIAKLQGGKDITLTASGAAMGTPHYMAPEQIEHPHDVDQRADIYSMGVVFYEMLTGELPLGRFAPPSEKSTVDSRVDEIVMRTLEKERELRFQSAGEVKTQVEYITSNPAPAGSIPTPPLVPSGIGSSSSSPSGGSLSGSASANRRQWSKRAIAAAVLAGVSLFEMGLVMVSNAHPSPREIMLLFILIGGPGLLGIGLGRMAMVETYAAPDRLRGGRLALIAIAAWPLVLFDGLLFAILLGLSRSLFRFLGAAPPILGTLGILTLNGFILWLLMKGWPVEKSQFAVLAALNWLKRLPRKVLWGSGFVFLALLFLTARSSRTSHQLETASPAQQVFVPRPPPGYSVSPGTPFEEGGREFHTSLTIPAGYVLTLTATLSSNQVVWRRSEPNPAAFIMAPAGQPIEGRLSWRLLGNTTLADGAPLEFTLGFSRESDPTRKTFHLTPPESLSIDWVSEPSRIWPPQNGHTKFVLMKGFPSAEQGFASSAEWAVGIETRLDPIPAEYFLNLNRGVIGLGSNWLSAEGKKAPAKPPTESAAPDPNATLEVP